ncbi:MAG: PilZ domain-containing protein [Anderseniella sp.]|nr:PilZ domain-containing protein [Anderseniella sp.]
MAMFGDQKQQEHKRAAKRYDCKQFGTLISPCGNFTEPCLVLNQSRTGALVEVEWADDVGDELLLVVDGDSYRRPARVAWRDTFRLGIEFILQTDSPENKANWILPLPVKESLPDDYFD